MNKKEARKFMQTSHNQKEISTSFIRVDGKSISQAFSISGINKILLEALSAHTYKI